MKSLRHVVNVMRPTTALDERGQLQGSDETITASWPCSIEVLSGSKAQTERMTIPTATHRVMGWKNPNKPLKDKDYIVWGDHKFTIELIDDVTDKLTLVCSEVRLG